MIEVILLAAVCVAGALAAHHYTQRGTGRGTGRGTTTRAHEFADDFDDEDDDLDAPPDRETWKTTFARPDGVWRRLGHQTEIAGVAHRRRAAERFCEIAEDRAMKSGEPSALELTREPANPHDPNAVSVHGVAGTFRAQLGYVDRATAAEIASGPDDMPIAAVLERVTRYGDRLHIGLQVLVPAKRAPFWKGRDYPF